MRFLDLRVGFKLSIAFGLLLTVTMALGTVSLWQVHRMDQTIEEVGEHAMPALSLAGNIRAQWNRFRRIEGLMLLDQASAANRQYATDLQQLIQQITELEARYTNLPLSSKEKQLLGQYREHRQAYLKAHEAYVASATDRDGDPLTTLTIFQQPAEKAFVGIAEAVGKLTEATRADAIQTRTEAYAVKNSAQTWVIGGMLASALLSVFFAVIVTRSIAAPALNALRVANRIADGDLSEKVHAGTRDEMGQLMQALEQMRLKLNSLVMDVRYNAESVAMASEEIATGSLQLSSRTEEQASALEQTAASMEELSTTVQLNAENARQANDMAHRAANVAEQGGMAVDQVVDTMRGIRAASTEITDIVEVIESIAFQTNILALNAAVEAARAGEQGRGFAVVAGEVRVLAGRCAEAAKQINHVVHSSAQRIINGVEMADRAGVTMQEVVQSITRVNTLVASITASSAEQSSGVEQIGHVIQELDTNTQKNAALVEENAAATDSLKIQAQALLQTMSIFKIDRHART